MGNYIKCPVCNCALVKQSQQFSCGRHHYDLAKEGYVHLNQNYKETAGDSKEMMQSRRDFLNLNHYEILVDYIVSLLNEEFRQSEVTVLDIGCGEGYYLDRILKKINATPCEVTLLESKCRPDEAITWTFIGLDISKMGIKFAAKRNRSIEWLVANSANLPIMNHSMDFVVSIFSIYNVQEVCRVLKKSGYMLVVRAGENHLIELRQIIYPEIIEKNKSAIYDDHYLDCIKEETLTAKVKLVGTESILKLLEMTPHYWKIKAEGKDALKKYTELAITLDFKLSLLKRK
jgi:23S rRNA (guanine745-N1)-methyltransferase